MPQMKFWAEEHECRFVAEYRFDPTQPQKPVDCTIKIYRQDGRVVQTGRTMMPPGFEDSAWPNLVEGAFRAWVVADGRAAVAHLKREGAAWRRAAEDSSQTR